MTQTNFVSDDISLALSEAFGDAPIDSIAPLAGGRSGAAVYLVIVGGSGYVLRKGDRVRPGSRERAERELACMAIAADLGVAPKLHYASVDLGISITEQVVGTMLGRSSQHIARVAEALRRLHQGPAFPSGVNVVALVRQMDERIRAQRGTGLSEPLVGAIQEAARLIAQHGQSAPCHNDLNPTNILETEDAVYFLDWEAAGMSDPYFDLAQLGVFNFPGREQREELLEVYLERRPMEEERAHMTVARVIVLGVYSASFFCIPEPPGSAEGAPPQSLSIPDLLAYLGTHRERASTAVAAVSLRDEMLREAATDAYAAARRLLLMNTPVTPC